MSKRKDEEEDSVRERIKTIRNHYKWTENSIAGDQATQKRLNRQLSHGGTLTLDTILLILDACPDVSADWLLLGRGKMFRLEEDVFPLSSISNEDTDPDIIRRLLSLLQEKDHQIDRLIGLLANS